MVVKKYVIATVVVLPVLLLIVWVSRNRLDVANESGQVIRHLTITVCDKTVRFKDIPPGNSVSATFGTPRDQSIFEVGGQLQDGTKFIDYCGYVVWEDYGKRFHLIIRPAGPVTCR